MATPKTAILAALCALLALTGCIPISPTVAPAGSAAPEPALVEQESQEGDGAGAYDALLAGATTQEGVVNVHQVDDKYYLEIPADLLGRELFWYSELAEMPASFVPLLGGLEVASRMVRLERRGETLYVRDLTEPLSKRAAEPGEPGEQPTSDEKVDPVEVALSAASLPAVIAALPIAAESPAGALVVDVTDFFAGDLPDFSPTTLLNFGGVQASAPASDRSYIDSIRVFPRNLEVRSFLTYMATGAVSSASVVLRHSITLLPDEPMMPRYADPRVGYCTAGYSDYSATGSSGIVDRNLINRYRLEKQDPTAAVSDPVQPIAYYIGPGWPDKWRPYVKQAVEDWQPAFEAAGFSNAIIALDAPTKQEDPTWDTADTRYSVIRWLEQPVTNAMGPNIHDPRTGEILSAHVLIWAEVLKLAEQWYFAQASALDERARTLPLPDELMGRLIRYIVSHEVGHSLGLRHNHRASQVFTVEQLRDPEFTAQYGTSPSIMSYGRFNYIAQPEDGVTNLVPQIGPYDHFAIQWGYTPIPEAATPEAEATTLDSWAARQLDDPFLAFGGEDDAASVDPNVQTENLGADRIEATRLGIRNLERVMGYLLPATTRAGGDFAKLNEMYQAVLAHRQRWLKSVIKLIGGVEENRTLAGRGETQFTRVERARQEAAVQFLLENLRTPAPFLAPEVLDNIGPFLVTKALADQQTALLGGLLSAKRYHLLEEQALLDPGQGYPLVEYLGDIQAGIFEELQADVPVIDPLRRSLQRHYLAALASQLRAYEVVEESESTVPALALLTATGPGTDLRAAVRYNLAQLAGQVQAAQERTSDLTTAAHLADLAAAIETILSGQTLMYSLPAAP